MDEKNFVRVIQNNCSLYQDKVAYIDISESCINEITYKQLHAKIEKLAGYLQILEMENETALIMTSDNLNSIISLFACIYANVIGVPVYPPKKNHHMERLKSIITNSSAKYILIDRKVNASEFTKESTFIRVDKILEEVQEYKWQYGNYSLDSIAYLQYTSGTTQYAKGAIVKHQNLIANLKLSQTILQLTDQDVFVSWLPFYHDLGLVGNIFLSFFTGGICVMFSSISFMISPKLWIRYISEYRATIIMAPNFAYQMCIDKITDDEIKEYNLISLRSAVNAAEPIRLETLHKFQDKYSPIGLRKNVLNPSYGLAENTLTATSHEAGSQYVVKELSKTFMKNNSIFLSKEGRRLVASGKILADQVIKIVSISDGSLLGDNQVGEIWIHSASVCHGYWAQRELTDKYFANQSLNDSLCYFKTSDVGFLEDNYLFNLGRLQDVILIKNTYYLSHDIEFIISQVASEIPDNAGVVFTTEDNNEQLIVVLEIDRKLRASKRESDSIREKQKEDRRKLIIERVNNCLRTVFSLYPEKILLIQEKSAPKTSSGKIQRIQCRKMYQNGELKIWESIKYDRETRSR
jgi:acyl-CoA synthetase (AMP-forming)/AMP-acid ligase II